MISRRLAILKAAGTGSMLAIGGHKLRPLATWAPGVYQVSTILLDGGTARIELTSKDGSSTIVITKPGAEPFLDGQYYDVQLTGQ